MKESNDMATNDCCYEPEHIISETTWTNGDLQLWLELHNYSIDNANMAAVRSMLNPRQLHGACVQAGLAYINETIDEALLHKAGESPLQAHDATIGSRTVQSGEDVFASISWNHDDLLGWLTDNGYEANEENMGKLYGMVSVPSLRDFLIEQFNTFISESVDRSKLQSVTACTDQFMPSMALGEGVSR